MKPRITGNRIFALALLVFLSVAVDGFALRAPQQTVSATQRDPRYPEHWWTPVSEAGKPDWEVLPYDQFSPLPDLVSERIATLARLPSMQRGILLVGAETLLQRLPPAGFIGGRSFQLATGESFSMARVSEQLARAGYSVVAQVSAPGEFAVRGSLFDVFPMGSDPHGRHTGLSPGRHRCHTRKWSLVISMLALGADQGDPRKN